jgi:hypothetical protein
VSGMLPVRQRGPKIIPGEEWGALYVNRWDKREVEVGVQCFLCVGGSPRKESWGRVNVPDSQIHGCVDW